ncbi:hypothetical protein CCR75_005642 [Bremia lactucae]|uniref:Uncharacterized protein n=1 Tax=Bremia lactucae TaxID=4779 RepID=A0A976IFV2_BRELC|nr:hypothetical protein CCR75_005642 [Bremia lactucae]
MFAFANGEERLIPICVQTFLHATSTSHRIQATYLEDAWKRFSALAKGVENRSASQSVGLSGRILRF